jgi:tRNA-specific 2-thiouridylase
MTNVLVAMSGGVDSSVAAALLVEQGYDVTGATLRLWGGESDSGCCSVGDVEDARRVAAQLAVPHYVLNLAEAFEADVVSPYVSEHAAGRTPNPCVECNRSIKFGALLERAEALGFDALATGHHARIVTGDDGTHRLRRGADAGKDQSYVLYMLTQRELARTVLPIGHLTKREVREHAARLGLRTAAKPESMDVCFITRGGRRRFLDERSEPNPGPIVDAAGTVVGRHAGVAHVTVGQRRGLGIAAGDRRYVVDVCPDTATVTIGERSDLLRTGVRLDRVTWVHAPPAPGATVSAQVRAHGEPLVARVRADGVEFTTPQPRVAPGQVVALYDGDALLGGGIVAA